MPDTLSVRMMMIRTWCDGDGDGECGNEKQQQKQQQQQQQQQHIHRQAHISEGRWQVHDAEGNWHKKFNDRNLRDVT